MHFNQFVSNSRIIKINFGRFFVLMRKSCFGINKFNKKQIRILLKIKWWDWTDDKLQQYSDLLEGDVDTFISTVYNK